MQLTYPNFQILVVDNGSTDETVSLVQSQYPSVEVVVNGTNMGFAAGCNVGFGYALEHGADHILLLNNDTVVDPAALDALVSLDAPDVGMITPKIYYAADPSRIWSVGSMCHRLTLEKTNDGDGQVDRGQWDKVVERDYVVGCAVLISRRLLDAIGLFDERFFMYYEDSDLSLRARRAGFRLLLSPCARVWHKVAVSSGGSDSPNERYWKARGSVLFFSKHVRGVGWLIVLPYRLGSAIKTTLKLLLQSRAQSAWAHLCGLADGLQITMLGGGACSCVGSSPHDVAGTPRSAANG
jgi:GT2 family glycosyltransferase